MKEENVKQFLVDRYTEKWLEENKGMMEDYEEICHLIMLFHANWGINVGIVFKGHDKLDGRGLGIMKTNENKNI